VKKLLAKKGPEIVFATIQKYVDRDLEKLGPDDELEDIGLLNDDEAILVMVDEAHRSHGRALHATLLQALPNCARIGFTGTPIIMGDKKRTHEIFGEFIDRYTLKESEADGATVPILYEGRYAKGAVADAAGLDDELFRDVPGADGRGAGSAQAKARHTQRHPRSRGGHRRQGERHAPPLRREHPAQRLSRRSSSPSAGGRPCATRRPARRPDALVAEAEKLDEATRQLDDESFTGSRPKLQAAVRAARQLDRLRALEFAAIISPDNNDPPEWRSGAMPPRSRAASNASSGRSSIATPRSADPLAFLIVKSMLLTGFDAPIEGVMYLDRPIREAELLQAIARVNRTGHGKTAGIVVDYYGLAKHLKEALTVYSAEDIEGALQSLKPTRSRSSATGTLAVMDLFAAATSTRSETPRQPSRRSVTSGFVPSSP
jgi:type I restriction enzyme R subunit